MTTDSIGSLIYLVLLGAVIGGYFFVSNRQHLGKSAQQLAIWGLIFLGAIVAFGMWSEIKTQVAPGQAMGVDGSMVISRGFDGHYHVTLDVQGNPVRFVVDTGATDIVLSQRDAASVGLDPDTLAYLGQAQTANGLVPLAQVTLRTVSLGGIVDENVRASVNGGDMNGSLLGMSYLERFGRIEIADGTLTLTR